MTRPAGGKPHYRLHCARGHGVQSWKKRLWWWMEWTNVVDAHGYGWHGHAFRSSAEAIRRAPR